MMTQYDTFISYRRTEQFAADALRNLLKAYGRRVFVDREDIPVGVPFREVVGRALREAPVVLLVWSRSAAASEEVQRELAIALEAKDAQSPPDKKIIPILLDGTPLPPALDGVNRIAFDRNQAIKARVAHLMERDRMSWHDAVAQTARELREDDSPLKLIDLVPLLMLDDGLNNTAVLLRQLAQSMAALLSPGMPDPPAVQQFVRLVTSATPVKPDQAAAVLFELGVFGRQLSEQIARVLGAFISLPATVFQALMVVPNTVAGAAQQMDHAVRGAVAPFVAVLEASARAVQSTSEQLQRISASPPIAAIVPKAPGMVADGARGVQVTVSQVVEGANRVTNEVANQVAHATTAIARQSAESLTSVASQVSRWIPGF